MCEYCGTGPTCGVCGRDDRTDVQRAVDRLRRAGVKAPDSSLLCYVQCVGPEVILESSFRDIRQVANAF